MALTFVTGGAQRVDFGNAASLKNLDPFTYLAWVRLTSKVDDRRIISKMTTGDSASNKVFSLSGTTGNIHLRVARSTPTDYITNTTPLATVPKWYFVAASYNSAASAGQIVNIYIGDLTTIAAEATYGTTTNGSGANTDDGTGKTIIGNRGAADDGFPGDIAVVSIEAAELTLAQIKSWQFNPRVLANTRLFCQLGFNGTSPQPDHSGNGNTGTVTSATLAAHIPLRSVWAVSAWRAKVLTIALAATDSATLTDTGGSIAQSATDSGALSEAAGALSATDSRTDTATLTDTSTLEQQRAVTDTATLSESSSLLVLWSRTDAFTASEASGDGTTPPAVAPLVSDGATLSESITGRQIELYDGAVLSESADRRQLLASSDGATLSESAVLTVVFSRTDAFTLTDATATTGLIAALSRTDSALLSDVSSGQPPSVLSRTDTIAFSDGAALLVLWSRVDALTLTDSGPIVGPLVTDAFVFSDVGRRANVGPVPLLRDPLRAVLVSNGRGGVRVLNPSEAATVNNGKTDATPD